MTQQHITIINIEHPDKVFCACVNEDNGPDEAAKPRGPTYFDIVAAAFQISIFTKSIQLIF